MQDFTRELLCGDESFAVEYSHSNVGCSMPDCHCHPHYEIYIQISGVRNYFIKDSVFMVQSGDIVVIPPYIMHRTSSINDMGYERILIDFDDNFVYDFLKYTEALTVEDIFPDDFSVLSTKAIDNSNLKSLCTRLVFDLRNKDKIFHADRKLLVGELLLLIYKLNLKESKVNATVTTAYKKVSEIIEFIEENFDKKITLDYISKKFYFSYYYLSHIFKDITGLSFTDYLNTVRVSKAREMIMSSNDSLAEISEKCGFGSYKQFGRIFKEVTGVSPSKYKI